jgi:hypothetical protein
MALTRINPDSPRSLDSKARTVTATYIKQTLATFAVVGVLYLLFGWWSDMPGFFELLFRTHMPMINGLGIVWYIFVIGASATALVGLASAIRGVDRVRDTKQFFTRGTWLALNAGVFEEIMYRWLRLIGAMAVLNILNIVTFGLTRLVVSYILTPVANWASLGILDRVFTGHFGWLIAGGVLIASLRFKSVHRDPEQGSQSKRGSFANILGVLTSWYFNLFMFYLVFTCGLWTAIVAHILYELCVYYTRGAMNSLRPRNAGRDFVDGLIRAAGRS